MLLVQISQPMNDGQSFSIDDFERQQGSFRF